MKGVLNYTVLLFLIIFMMGPIVWLAILSFKPDAAILGEPFAPFQPTLIHYANLFSQFGFTTAIQNSLIIASIVLVITLPTAALAAYGLSRYPPRGTQLILVFILFCRIIVPAILVLPLYDIISLLNLKNTIAGIVLGHLSWQLPFAILILHSFIEEVPKQMEEAAFLDGAGRFGTFWRIVFPQLAPGIAVVSLFAFGGSWNEFLFAVSFASSSSLRTGPVAISVMTTEYKVYWGELAAGGILWSIPMIILSVVFNKYMTKGVRLGY
jgi:ABC-type glycerol-3-phosphate transport system permease component